MARASRDGNALITAVLLRDRAPTDWAFAACVSSAKKKSTSLVIMI